MKIIRLFSIVLITILFALTVKAQTYEHFSSFRGIPFAKAKVLEQGFTDYKLIFIGAYSEILKTVDINTTIDGNTQNWYYIFICDNDSRLISIGITKQNGVFIADLMDDCPSDQVPKIGKVDHVFKDFKELPADLLNSDYVYIEHSCIKSKIQTDSKYIISRIELSSRENSQIHPNILINEEYFWIAGFDIIDSPFGSNSDSEIFFISAKTGEMLDWWFTTDIKETLLIGKSIIYPNPATDYIEISSINHTLKRGVDEGSDIQIFDMLGIPVTEIHPIKVSNRMNIEHLSPGIYFIKIGNRVEKFVKR